MEKMETFNLDSDFLKQIRREYFQPFYTKIIFFVFVQILVFVLFTKAMQSNQDSNGNLEVILKNGGSFALVNMLNTKFFWMQVAFHCMIFTLAYASFSRVNINLLKDFKFGKGIQERITIVDILETPAANIYITDSSTIKTIVENFPLRVGDNMTIYYLKYSARLLHIGK